MITLEEFENPDQMPQVVEQKLKGNRGLVQRMVRSEQGLGEGYAAGIAVQSTVESVEGHKRQGQNGVFGEMKKAEKDRKEKRSREEEEEREKAYKER